MTSGKAGGLKNCEPLKAVTLIRPLQFGNVRRAGRSNVIMTGRHRNVPIAFHRMPDHKACHTMKILTTGFERHVAVLRGNVTERDPGRVVPLPETSNSGSLPGRAGGLPKGN